MKKLITLLSFSFSILAFAQVQDYPYIITNKDTSEEIKNTFIKKNYKIFDKNKSSWTDEMKLNPCATLHTNISEKSGILSISFVDCNNVTVTSWEGEILKFKNWLPSQTAIIPNYRGNETKTVTIVKKSTKKAPYVDLFRQNEVEKEETLAISGKGEIFISPSNEEVKVTNLPNSEFILSKIKNNHIIARFYPSSQSGIYHVKVLQKTGKEYFTIGFVKNDKIYIELRNDSISWNLSEFKKKK